MNSRAKGKRGELELKSLLRTYGYDAHRGVQYQGGQDSPDVVGLPFIHIECKRVEKLNIYEAYEQSKRDAGVLFPVVMHRKNDCEWLVTMSDDTFHTILRAQPMVVCFTRFVITKSLHLYSQISSTMVEAKKNRVTAYAVAHKRPDDSEILITMPLKVWMPIYREFELSQNLPKEEQG